MSSVIASFINLITGALWNKLCDHTANKLKEGDLTDEKCRQLIVRELDDIKSKLDGLARKDLLSSISFLGDGVCLLNLSLKNSTDDMATYKFPQEQRKNTSRAEISTRVEYKDSKHPESSVLNEALTLSQGILKVTSQKRFISAKSSFEKAYTKATEAFNNEALGIEDRILASKLRVTSRILESLDDPDAAAAFCKLYLQQLHDMPAIQKIFSVHFSRGMKSRFNKTKRLESVKFVMMINYILFDFTQKFTKIGPDSIFSWPKIKLAKRTFQPLLVENEIVKRIEKCGIYPPNQFRFDESRGKWPGHSTLNGKGDVIVNICGSKRFDVVNCKGEKQFSFFLSKEDAKARNSEVLALATDTEDDIYVVSRFKLTDKVYYELSVFDTKGNIIKQIPLEFLTGPGESHHSVCIAINKDKNIFITKQDEARVFVFDSSGQLKRSFAMEAWHLIKHLCISDKNEIIAAELIGKTVGIYSEEGEFKRNIKVAGLHKVRGLAFNYTTEKIILLTEVLPSCSNNYQLESFSETGEHLQTLLLPEKRNDWYKIISHPNGPIAVVHKTGVAFVQHSNTHQ